MEAAAVLAPVDHEHAGCELYLRAWVIIRLVKLYAAQAPELVRQVFALPVVRLAMRTHERQDRPSFAKAFDWWT
jgi:hypothetical protein